MIRLRRKPVEVDAVAWDPAPEGERPPWLAERFALPDKDPMRAVQRLDELHLRVLVGELIFAPGDLVIRHADGTLWKLTPAEVSTLWDAV